LAGEGSRVGSPSQFGFRNNPKLSSSRTLWSSFRHWLTGEACEVFGKTEVVPKTGLGAVFVLDADTSLLALVGVLRRVYQLATEGTDSLHGILKRSGSRTPLNIRAKQV
jgi:hypothetical protein